jgi:DNA repair protein RecN (Recombination protein N)
MLRHLRIEDYALIERLEIEFQAGLNLLTGETGSGKSIVVDALGLLLGDKASSEAIRSGAERARVVGVFSPGQPSEAAAPARSRKSAGDRSKPASGQPRPGLGRWARIEKLLAESGIEPPGDGGEVIVQRDILPAGRSRIFLNNQPATVALLKTLAPALGEVHGQNEQQELFQPRVQRESLDRHGNLLDRVARVGEHFEAWKALRQRAETLARENQEWLRQRDLWQFQQREIEQAALVAGEEERLDEEKRILAHAERIQSRLDSCYEQLYDSPHSAVAAIGAAQKHLEEIASFDAALEPLAETLASARAALEDLALTVRDRLSRWEANPARLEQIQNRLELLDRLKRKYGATIQDVLNYGTELRQKAEQGVSGEDAMRELEEQVRAAAKRYEAAAGELTVARVKAAKDLKRAVEKELETLAMAGTKFEVRLTSSVAEQNWSAAGLDSMEFLISPNPGEPLRPLARIASGGEASRIMLALETVVASRPECAGGTADHTLVFDEVDSGIGGRAAEAVGSKLRQLGEHRQVLCVTHLPQIASFAQRHFRVEKLKRGNRTVTEIHPLDGQERRVELARMLSGTEITPAVLEHAEHLLKAHAE